MKLELYRAHTPRARAVASMPERIYGRPVRIRALESSMMRAPWWQPLPTYCARLCAWAESTWWAVSIRVANKTQYLQRSWAFPNNSNHTEASFSAMLTDTLYLRVDQMPRFLDLAIFVLTTDNSNNNDRQNRFHYPTLIIGWGAGWRQAFPLLKYW